ncbi:MAG: YggS family pyridoxal phosphate-dependent enzyme [Anaerolineae bacterium]|jgi:pyridoxal phosphate enzyme (YggS family)|nr:MAG: YggS family pyridoxal phosphate-dependent enzyme [Anaerolineae bacterium]
MNNVTSIDDLKSQIANNYQQVKERIAEACLRVHRSPEEVTLVVVTKGHSVERIRCAIELGLNRFGENYVEEGSEKIEAIGQPKGIEWHMIGHIQSRKAEMVVQYFDVVHSLDSLKVARRLERFATQKSKIVPVLLECNVSGEESKFGFFASDPNAWDDLLPDFIEIAQLPHLEIRGLMTMAPFYENPEHTRPVFRKLVELQGYLRTRLPEVCWDELSMGMSSDFEVAIEEGATIVRIGQAILGERPVSLGV